MHPELLHRNGAWRDLMQERQRDFSPLQFIFYWFDERDLAWRIHLYSFRTSPCFLVPFLSWIHCWTFFPSFSWRLCHCSPCDLCWNGRDVSAVTGGIGKEAVCRFQIVRDLGGFFKFFFFFLLTSLLVPDDRHTRQLQLHIVWYDLWLHGLHVLPGTAFSSTSTQKILGRYDCFLITVPTVDYWMYFVQGNQLATATPPQSHSLFGCSVSERENHLLEVLQKGFLAAKICKSPVT